MRALAAVLPVFAWFAQTPLPKGMDAGIALGQRLAEDFERRVRVIDNEDVAHYLDDIGARIVSALPDARNDYRFRVITGDRGAGGALREPAWFPGGFVYVPAELITSGQSEAELAGMLAHAVAHIAGRHASRIANRAGAAPVRVIHVWGSENALLPKTALAYVRELELEADRRAVELMAKAGFDPGALVAYVERNQVDATGRDAEFSPVPLRDVRLDQLQQAVWGFSTLPYSSPTGRFHKVQREVRRLVTVPPRTTPSLRNPRR